MSAFNADHAVVEMDSDAQRDCFCQQAFVDRIAHINNRRNSDSSLRQRKYIMPSAIM